MRSRLWIDVEDLFIYAQEHKRPSGIQRLAFEICRALQVGHGASGQVHFVRHDGARAEFRIIAWTEVAELFAGLSGRESVPANDQPANIRPHGQVRQYLRVLASRLPFGLRLHLAKAIRLQIDASRAWARLLLVLLRGTPGGVVQLALWLYRSTVKRLGTMLPGIGGARTPDEAGFANLVRPGDILLVPGSPWSHPNYAALAQKNREKYGIRCALLVYDIIPLRHPEWFDRDLIRLFRASMNTLLPQCDFVFAISHATAADLAAYGRECGVVPRGPVVTLPIGTEFTTDRSPAAEKIRRSLPASGSYALIVSTIEPRKNHVLLFRIWQRLLRELPPERVPTLVFAGHVGWLVADLVLQIANTGYLDGKLVLIEDPTDSELTVLYQGCLFTLFPSLYEGWGLPVSESLAHGKPCLISNRTSLPEAGGSLAKSFDPDNLNDAYAAVREVIEDRAGLEQWEMRIRRDYKPVPWSVTVEALLSGLEHS